MDTTGTGATPAQGAAHVATEQAGQVAGAAADQARQVAGTAAEEARAVVTAAKDQLGEVSAEVRDQARSLLEDSKAQLQNQAQTQTERIAENLRRIGDELRALTEGRADEAGMVGDYARQAATSVNRFAGRIEERGLDGLMTDVQRFARRKPGTFLLGALAAGFGVGRLVRAGSGDTAQAPGSETSGTFQQPSFPSNAAMPLPTTPEGAPVSSSPPMVDAGAVVGMDTGVQPSPVGTPPTGATS